MAVAALGCDVDDPAVLLARAELALDRAGRLGDGTSRRRSWPTPACGPADDAAAAGAVTDIRDAAPGER
ncbi:MAG: hypothetical protein M3179_10545 [Actinomycetota bacterium]|nr:hypothetical protein [Actinomycetota bacterium]